MSDDNPSIETSARVSISQRLIPSVSFGLVALSGAFGAWWVLQLFNALKGDKSATVKTVMDGLGSIEQSVGMILLLAAIIGFISIVVVFMRSSDDEATLPGYAYVIGFPCLISPGITAYLIYLVIHVFHTSLPKDMAKFGGDIAELAILSLVTSGIALLILLPFVFLPFRAKIGRRISPAITIGLFTACVCALVAITFWLVGYSQEPAIAI